MFDVESPVRETPGLSGFLNPSSFPEGILRSYLHGGAGV